MRRPAFITAGWWPNRYTLLSSPWRSLIHANEALNALACCVLLVPRLVFNTTAKLAFDISGRRLT